jgi:3-methyladenine DNA glycosylase AlkC
MAEPFKNLIHAGTVARAGQHLRRVWPAFDRARFESLATTGLETLDLKARAMLLADALEATLPDAFAKAAEVIEASLAPPMALDTRGEPVSPSPAERESGISGWAVWSLGEFVVRRGMIDVPRALRCLHALTQRFSAEFAIRPFIAQHPQPTLATLAQWVHDPSVHVRRLVSEGSRPRLPWGQRLQALVRDPAPTLPLLRALQDDPSAYVRRSVANHLNDIAKDHPELVAQWVHDHRLGASAQRSALLRHASRKLIKQGHGPTLAAWGLGQPLRGQAELALSASRVAIGDTLGLHVTLRSGSRRAQTLAIDYTVYHVRANGGTSVKVFKGWALTLAPCESRLLDKRHSLRPVTTRRQHPGPHRIDLRINGQVAASAGFELLD